MLLLCVFQEAGLSVSPCLEGGWERAVHPWELWFSKVSCSTWGNVGWGRQCLPFSALEHVLVHKRSSHLLHGTFGRLLCFQQARLEHCVYSSASACFSAAFPHSCTSQNHLKYSFFTSCLLVKRLKGMCHEEQLRTLGLSSLEKGGCGAASLLSTTSWAGEVEKEVWFLLPGVQL